LAQPTRQSTSALLYLSLLRCHLTDDMDAHTPPGGSLLLPPHRRSTATSPPSWFRQVQRRPPSLRCSWPRTLSLPSTPSLPLAAAPSDPHLEQPPPPPQMTQAMLDLVGVSEEAAAWPFLFVFLCFASSLHGYLATLARCRGRLTPCKRLVA
jgi:hypothetical protein